MFRFNFESAFETKKELRDEIEHLLWQIDRTWPVHVCPGQLSWIKPKVDQAFVKINGGTREQTVDSIEVSSKQEAAKNMSKILRAPKSIKPLRGQMEQLISLDDCAFYDEETGHPCEKCGKPLRKMPDNYRGRSPKCEHCGYQDMKK